MIDEKVLSDALHEMADRDDPGVPPAGLLHRGHRARLGRAARTATVAAAASVLAASGVALAVTGPGAGGVPLALAAQTTAETTFHFRIESTLGPGVYTVPWDGRYDPVHNRGYMQTMPVGPLGWTFEERQIGTDCFFGNNKEQWYRTQSCMAGFMGSPENANAGESAGPGELLAQLKSAGKVSYTGRTGKGRNAVDTYQFTYIKHLPHWSVNKTGTVDIDVTSRRIVKVSYRITSLDTLGTNKPSGQTDLRFDDFGTRVDVAPPAQYTDPGPSTD